MIPIMTKKGGQAMGFPDTCTTPGIAAGAPGPFTWPNTGSCSGGDGTDKVKCNNKNILRQGDKAAGSSNGDQGGNSPGGLVCGQFGKVVKILMGWPIFKAAGKMVGHLGSMTSHNNNNCPCGAAIAPSDTSVDLHVLPGMGGPTGDDPVLDALDVLICSETLQTDINTLVRQGWEIKYGPPGETECFCDTTNKRIVIGLDEKDDPSELVTTLAHEVGHAFYTQPYHPPTSGMLRQTYVSKNVREALTNEGHAVMNNIEVKNEIKDNPSPHCQDVDIAVAGDTGEWEEMVNDPSNSEDRCIRKIARDFRNRTPKGGDQTYPVKIGAAYEKFWTETLGHGIACP